MANATAAAALPPLPPYTLQPQLPLIPGLPDKYASLLLPVLAYWALSLFFHWIDVNDFFPQYRLHTPTEISQRNRVSRWEVFRDVVLQQMIQTATGVLIGYFEPDAYEGKEQHDVAVWAQRIRLAQSAVPALLSLLGVNAAQLAGRLSGPAPMLAGLIAGGSYPTLVETLAGSGVDKVIVPAFARWEVVVAGSIYWALMPALKFLCAVLFVDTWQYFWHRGMHLNKWLYVTFHSRHHRLYVPYAYGALYNHPVEGFLLDTLGAGLAYMITGMTARQGMVFFTFSTLKTVDDHCGYSLPWDPLQHLSANNAGYHDIHHQSWGIKSNFSQPFFVFWDRFMGTMWSGGDISSRYQKSRVAAEQKASLQEAKRSAPTVVVQRPTADKVLQEKPSNRSNVSTESSESTNCHAPILKSIGRKRAASISQAGSLKNLRERVQARLLGRPSSVLGVDSEH